MDKVKYLSNQTTAQNGQYPVTIQGLEFIQRQIMTLHSMVFVGGDYYIIKESTATEPGVVVFNGEIMPLSGVPIPTGFINVVTTKETIHTNAGNYTDVREVRMAAYNVQKQGEEFRERKLIKEWRTNTVLWEKLSELMRTGQGIPIESGIFNRIQLDKRTTTARLICLQGSSLINNYQTYAVDVYTLGGGAAYQELLGPDFRRWGRYYDPGTKVWGEFQPISEQFAIEAKVTSTGVFFRHGFLPPYVNLIALRKKTRSRKTGKVKDAGGVIIKNRPNRPLKNAWYNSWKMIFSQGKPNTWYAPKCLDADWKFRAYLGYEFGVVLRALLFKSTAKGWQIAGVHRNWTKRPYGYTKIALGIVTGESHAVPVLTMARLKFRVSPNPPYTSPNVRFTTD